MRYTRYNYRNKKKISATLIKFIVILIICGGTGVIAAKFFFGELSLNGFLKGEAKPVVKENVVDEAGSKEAHYTLIQCGVFSKKENVDNLMNKIKDDCNGFVVQEGEEWRVIAGIYTKGEEEKIVNDLNNDKVETSKMEFYISNSDRTGEQMIVIVDSYLNIIRTLEEKDVKSVDTKDFKKWVNDLGIIDSGEHIKELQNLKKIMVNMPEKITKDESKNSLIEIYRILLKFKI